jgi:lantibiotic modifying enzyme
MSSDDPFLGAAESIGRRIAADAIWHDGVCSWMGAVVDRAQPWRSEYRALEPHLYDGTAGVGLFLAQLAAVTGDAAIRRTAVGALRHALGQAVPGDGFHAGSLGIAWAAARGAALLGKEELHVRARAVPGPPSSAGDRCPDVIHGSAGSILALLALADGFDDPALVRGAVATGDELVACATITPHGWSWALPDRPHRRHLCGLAHGAAGIGWALVELLAVTGDDRFRTGALGAFAYERSWLDAPAGTWADLRIGGQRRGAGRRIPSSAVGTWCHGEAGIALSRLRAIEVLGAEPCRADAEVAFEATRRHLAATLRDEIEDLTLCHGAAGSADALLCGAAAFGDGWRKGADLGREFGVVALERYTNAWPCGPAGGITPALFVGLSGIGWWFLRLHDGTTPSPLTLPIRGRPDAPGA